MQKEKLMGNIGKNYIYTLFFNLNLTRGLWMIYLAGKGFSLLELGIFEGTFHATSFLMEVPTGVVADLWGRKTSRLCGRVLFLISLFIMLLSDNFYIQLSGFILCAMGYNLESGAGEALVYDSLLLAGNEAKYKSIAGRQELILQCGFISSYLLGGYLAVRNFPAVYFMSIIFSAASFLTALAFIEPVISENREKKSFSLKNIAASMYNQTRESILAVKRRPRIAFLILFSEIIFTFLTSLFFYLQNYWKGTGLSEFSIGIIFAVAALTAGITGYNAQAIEKTIGEKGVLLFMPLILVLCLWGIAITRFKGLFFILTGIIEGILVVAISDYINRLIPSERRATVLSFQAMAFSFFMLIFFPAIGWIGDSFSLDISFLFLAVSGSALTAVYFVTFKTWITAEQKKAV